MRELHSQNIFNNTKQQEYRMIAVNQTSIEPITKDVNKFLFTLVHSKLSKRIHLITEYANFSPLPYYYRLVYCLVEQKHYIIQCDQEQEIVITPENLLKDIIELLGLKSNSNNYIYYYNSNQLVTKTNIRIGK
jgi:hypothetical protein